MPGFLSHYLFGIEAYQRLPKLELRQTIKIHRATFILGLQGPDIFFYHLPVYLQKQNIGSIMHTQKTNLFFENMIHEYQSLLDPEKKEILAAYLSGFLGHYMLDKKLHPFIYAKTFYHPEKKTPNSYYGIHMELESILDASLWEQRKEKKGKQLHAYKTIPLNKQEQKQIAAMLTTLIPKTYQHSISLFSMQSAIHSMHLCRKVLQQPVFSSTRKASTDILQTDCFNLSHKAWKNPWNPKLISTKSVIELWEEALREYYFLLLLFQESSSKQASSFHSFLSAIGNDCYHSGLPL